MPKSQYVDPAKAFDAGYIKFSDIPVCQYNKTLKEELKSDHNNKLLFRVLGIYAYFHSFSLLN